MADHSPAFVRAVPIGDGNGGGIYQLSSDLTWQSCIIWGNEAAVISPEIDSPDNSTYVNSLVKGYNPGGANLDGTSPANVSINLPPE